MSFLRINGWSIPVSWDAGEETIHESGERGRSFNGAPWMHRRAIRRSWSGRTAPRSDAEARALIGAILGRGYHFPFDGDAYASGGAAPVASTVGSFRRGVAADGAPVVDLNGVPESRFGSHALTVEPAVTNLLPEDARNSDVDGFSGVSDASISQDSQRGVHGLQSVKVETVDGNDAVFAGVAATVFDAEYAGSIYVYAESAYSMRADLLSPLPFASQLFTSVPGSWVRVSLTGSTLSPGVSSFIGVTSLESDPIEFWVASPQIEEGSIATTFANPSRAAGSLAYPVSLLHGFHREASVSFWAKMPAANPDDTVRFFDARRHTPTFGHGFRVERGNANIVTFHTAGEDGSGHSVSDTGVWDGDWHMITVSVTRDGLKSLYVDGVLVGSATTDRVPDFRKATAVRAGNSGAASTRLGNDGLSLMDDLVIVPYAMHPDQVKALYNLGRACSPLPRLHLDGDAVGSPVLALGSVERSAFVGAAIGGTFSHTNRALNFALDEIGPDE